MPGTNGTVVVLRVGVGADCDRRSLASELVSEALRNAIESRRPRGDELLHSSDRGCQNTSDASKRWTKALRNWKEALNHFAIVFEERMPTHID